MPVLATFEKQPAEIQDYDIDFSEYLGDAEDTGASHTVTVPAGITKVSSTLVDGVVKVWLSGGTNGAKYRITATLTTTGGRVKEAEIDIKVKEV